MENEVMINEEVMDAVVEEVCESRNLVGPVLQTVGIVALMFGAYKLAKKGYKTIKEKRAQKAEATEESNTKVMDV